MAASKNAQLALIAVGAALLFGAIAVFGLPERDGALTSVGDSAVTPASAISTSPRLAETAPAAADTQAVDTASAAAPAETAPAPAVPAFDVVRVGPQGDSVIAGRAAPGKRLELLVDGKIHDRAEVNESGAFALTPPPLSAGDHQLTLREVGKDGAATLSQQSVTVVLSPDRALPPVVALTEPDRPTALLSDATVAAPASGGAQSPEPAARAMPATPPGEEPAAEAAPASVEEPSVSQPAGEPRKVAISTVETEAGRLYVSGQAPAGAPVRLYLNDAFLAQGKASPSGALTFRLDSGVPAGDYQVRLDAVTEDDGKVDSRAEVAFSVPETVSDEQQLLAGAPDAAAQRDGPSDSAEVVVPEVRAVRVERGDSLWRISRRIYGHGVRYTVIYDANQDQIRNPHRIYPGQVFVLPKEAADADADRE